MKLISFASVFSIVFFAYSQRFETALISEGEIPEFIDFQNSFVERVPIKTETDYLDAGKNFERILYQVLNSGKIVFGDKICDYLQKITDSLNSGDTPIKTYVVKSNKAITFSSNNKELFVSTGLISQVLNPEQLAFFISREIEIIHQQLNLQPKNKKVDIPSFEEKINFLATFNEPEINKIDSLGFIRFIKSGYNATNALSCIDVLLYSFMPFDQKQFPTDYFNTANFYIPKKFFDVYGEKGELQLDNSTVFKSMELELSKRRNKLNSLISANDSNIVSNSNSDDRFFFIAQKESRTETVRQNILTGNYNDAIYNIFLLESIYETNEYLDKLKAHAWLGYFIQESGSSNRWEKLKYQNIHGESSKFLFTLRKLNADGVGAFAIRIIYDLRQKYNTNEYQLIWNQLMHSLNTNKFFSINKFSAISYEEAANQFIQKKESIDNAENKYDKINNARASSNSNNFDSTEFYFYGLHDIVQDSILFREIINSKIDTVLYKTKSLEIYPFIQIRKPSGAIKEKKSSMYTDEFYQIASGLNELTKLTIQKPNNELDYNQLSILKETMSQAYTNNNYSAPFVPLYLEELSRVNLSSDYYAISNFESIYRLNLKGYHFLALFILPLPVIIPDLFIRSIQTKQCMMIIDSKTGEMKDISYTKYYEPLTRKLMVNRLYYNIYKNVEK